MPNSTPSSTGTGKEQLATTPAPVRETDVERRAAALFRSIGGGAKETVTLRDLAEALAARGIQIDDPRLADLRHALAAEVASDPGHKLDFEAFSRLIARDAAFVEKTLSGNLVIPDFRRFSNELHDLFEALRADRTGAVADYIPQLARVDPEHYALSVCTVDGQRFDVGDVAEPYCAQSTCKPINYCLALDQIGQEAVHQHVGREPSGLGFSELTLNRTGLPHNPMINAGAIMCCALTRPDESIADRFDYVMSSWRRLAGGMRVGFNNAVYLSEKGTADRNFALGYFMREKGAFPKNTNLLETLEFYFQCCSIEVTTKAQATVAATLANGGVCPVNGERVLQSDTVKDCLSLMYSCGMYDFSGEFAFTVGLPAKSGVSGALMVVVPNVMGITIWSPRLDTLGNSVRGVRFCQELVKRYNFHTYDSFTSQVAKHDPRRPPQMDVIDEVVALCWAASRGDVSEAKRRVAAGATLDTADYDGRTPLHLAASEGQLDMVEFIAANCDNLSPLDRWGNAPLDDAMRGGHDEVSEALKAAGARRGH